jgi:hypothetical protein
MNNFILLLSHASFQLIRLWTSEYMRRSKDEGSKMKEGYIGHLLYWTKWSGDVECLLGCPATIGDGIGFEI